MDNHEAFDKSYSKFIKKLEGGAPESDLENAFQECGLSGYPGSRFMAIKAFEKLFQDLEQHYGQCQSPIEQMMLSALLLIEIERGGEVTLVSKHFRDTFNAPDIDKLTIEMQAGLGDYRADFLLTYVDGYGSFRLQGLGTDPAQHVVSLIVECDGHDFHDRTKEQASRDRKRDRFLQSTGLQVFRYTGSDIWKDVCACAEEAIRRLWSLWHEKFGDDVKRVEDAVKKSNTEG